MAIDATPAAQRRRLSRFPGPSPRPRPGSQLAVPSTPAATPPPNGPRKSRLSALIYSPPDSTTSSPSLSAPPPFEWDAVRSNATPLYGPPGKPAKINAATGSPMRTPKKRIFRKANIIERIRSAPSRVAFEISMFPHNLPLPPPKETGQILGVLMHITHMCAKWAGRSQAALKDDPDDIWKREVDWSGIDEGNGSRWSWSTPITLLLLITSLLNALYMFTRIRTYQLQHRNELVKSVHASIVTKDSPRLASPRSPYVKALYLLLQSFKIGWRLAFGTSPRPEDLIPVDLQSGANKIQQLEVWNPGELETNLFVVYSPAHFLMWRIFATANWFSSLLLMGTVSLQMYLLVFAYEGLIKDKTILSAEVLHEYDTKFVNPRLHKIKRDVGTMTNEAEMVDRWRGSRYRG